jgi:hypothetical protein
MKFVILIGVFCAMVFSGCDQFAGLKVPQPGTACNLSSDQEGTLMGPVAKLPIPLYIDPSFSSSRKSDIRNAAEQWNQFSQYSLHKKFFEYKGERKIEKLSQYYSGRDFCGEQTEDGLYVVAAHTVKFWEQLGYTITTAGVTQRCAGVASRDLPITNPHIVVYLNSAELKDDLFFGVTLHELGHVLGLDHSCSKVGDGWGSVACAQLPESHPYRKAVMTGQDDLRSITYNDYTYLAGTSRSHLEQNDLDRAYCLYSR